MSYDWFVAINNTYQPMFQEIADMDRRIKGTSDRDKKNKLKKDRENLWNKTWDKIYEKIPVYGSLMDVLTSVSFEHGYLEDILRERYIELIHKNGTKIIETDFETTQLGNFFKTLKIPQINSLNTLPLFSFFLQFSFTLATPYISKDDEEFYVCENSIRKEKVFKVPMVAGSSWKGNLRWTAMKIFTDKLPDTINELTLNEYFGSRSQIVRLFGHEKDTMEDYLDTVLAEALCNDEEKKNSECVKEKKEYVKEEFEKFLRNKGYMGSNVEGKRGRLNFYPTFFDQIGLEVINPHDRKTKAGTVPIYIENVPEGATGTFTLLYVPFDLMGRPTKQVKEEIAQDIETICEAVKEMMTVYGFSAKKTSGFGVIKDSIQGCFLS
ncbi:MAG: RAMP superfamily CRISPR-associated protein, partial [bacterium]|nr:RAMP superfamily CRISPR-associated protein [bacterium]